MNTRIALLLVTAALGCGDPSGPTQSIHSGFISQNQMWRVADSPHLVRGWVIVSSGATLTIEAGATVLFEPQASLSIGWFGSSGTLRAIGSASAPITMQSLSDTAGQASWVGLRFRSSTTSEVRYVNISGCGMLTINDGIPPTCIALGSPRYPDENPTILLQDVTIENGRGGAVGLWNSSSFAVGSSRLTVRNMRGHVASFRAREANRFPLGGTFTENDTNEVRLRSDTLTTSLTLQNGVPWAAEGDLLIEGMDEPILTIAAGATVRLSGLISTGVGAPGGIQIGESGGPTVNLLPRSTSWGGIHFRANTVRSFIRNAELDSCGSEGSACLRMVGSFTGGPAPSPTLENVVIRDAIGGGISMSFGGRPGVGSANLTITGASGDAIGLSESLVGAIPSGRYTGNARDRIAINNYHLREDDSWPDRGVPYFLTGNISIGDSVLRPTLTIEPGVTVMSPLGGRLRVGEQAGAILARGTDARPIIFTGATNESGSWVGIVIGGRTEPTTTFEHVIVENAGGYYQVRGGFQFYVDIGPVIRNSTIRNSAACGVNIINQPPWSTDFTDPALGNTFTNNLGGAVCGP